METVQIRNDRARTAAFAAIALVFSLTGFNANASVIGTANTANCYPFSCASSFSVIRYQQVYSSTAFSGLSAINRLSFYAHTVGQMDHATYSLSLSTTSNSPGSLDTIDTNNNIGNDNTFLGSWTLSGLMPETLSFEFADFLYDPTAGNLLLTVDIHDLVSGSFGSSFFKADTSGALTSRAFTNQYGTFSDSLGLVTGFNLTLVDPPNPVPEPATLGLLGAGLAGLASLRRRRRIGHH